MAARECLAAARRTCSRCVDFGSKFQWARTNRNFSVYVKSDIGQKRQLSSVEVTKALTDRIVRLDGALRSYATRTFELALAQAREVDRELASGKVRGPLHGVPIAVKDLCNTKGIPTAAGMAIYKDYRPDEDATVVTRLRDAGAVLLGKLQMTEGAYGQHHPSITPPVNPWSSEHWTGVSSSGSGVATAAGLCFGSLARILWGRSASRRP